jgi:sulfur carrier protein ThiS
MHVKVTLHSYLAEFLPADQQGETTLEFEEGTQLQEIAQRLGLPAGIACAVNDSIERNPDRVLKDGDHIRYLRPGAGG